MTSNTWNISSVRFSSNFAYALCDIAEFMEGASHDDRSSIPFLPDRDSG